MSNDYANKDAFEIASELEAFERDYVTTTRHGALVKAAVDRLRDVQHLAFEQGKALHFGNEQFENLRRRFDEQAQVVAQRNQMIGALRRQVETLGGIPNA